MLCRITEEDGDATGFGDEHGADTIHVIAAIQAWLMRPVGAAIGVATAVVGARVVDVDSVD